MSNFPIQLRQIIETFGVSPQQYDLWVSREEAAHVVVALNYGARIEAIETSPQMLGTALSRARVRGNAPINGTHALHVFAAGAACDELHAQRFGIPPALIERVSQDQADAIAYMRQNIRGEWSEGVFMQMWRLAVNEMKNFLQQPEVAAKVERLGQMVFDAMQSGRDVSESEIQTAVGNNAGQDATT